jgi:hypothetical protein
MIVPILQVFFERLHIFYQAAALNAVMFGDAFDA